MRHGPRAAPRHRHCLAQIEKKRFLEQIPVDRLPIAKIDHPAL